VEILTVPNAALLTSCLDILPNEISEWKKTALQIQKIMEDKHGIGLAAPQVGINRNFFIACLPKPIFFINPVVHKSGEVVLDFESCLSIPGKIFIVPRNINVSIKAIDLDGNSFSLNLTDWNARIVQHEYDHLKGILISEIGNVYEQSIVKKN
jgi:peptide deformylase